MKKNILTVNEMNVFLTECIELCKRAVFKAAKKLKKKESFDNVEEYVEALGEAKFPQKYKKEIINLVDDLGTKVGVDKFEVDDLNKIADIPSELVSTIQLGIWMLESLPNSLKDSDIGAEMFSGF